MTFTRWRLAACLVAVVGTAACSGGSPGTPVMTLDATAGGPSYTLMASTVPVPVTSPLRVEGRLVVDPRKIDTDLIRQRDAVIAGLNARQALILRQFPGVPQTFIDIYTDQNDQAITAYTSAADAVRVTVAGSDFTSFIAIQTTLAAAQRSLITARTVAVASFNRNNEFLARAHRILVLRK